MPRVTTRRFATTKRVAAGDVEERDHARIRPTFCSSHTGTAGRTMFPLGGMEKPAVRELARTLGIPLQPSRQPGNLFRAQRRLRGLH